MKSKQRNNRHVRECISEQAWASKYEHARICEQLTTNGKLLLLHDTELCLWFMLSQTNEWARYIHLVRTQFTSLRSVHSNKWNALYEKGERQRNEVKWNTSAYVYDVFRVSVLYKMLWSFEIVSVHCTCMRIFYVVVCILSRSGKKRREEKKHNTKSQLSTAFQSIAHLANIIPWIE